MPIVLDAHWASILEILHFQVYKSTFAVTIGPSILTPFFENKSNVFVCCALQGRIVCTAGEIFAVVGPDDALRSNAERSQPRAPALSKAGTDARTGREQSLCRVHILATVCTLCSASAVLLQRAPMHHRPPHSHYNVGHEGSLAPPTPGGLRTPPASLTARHGNSMPCIIIIPFPVNNTSCSLGE